MNRSKIWRLAALIPLLALLAACGSEPEGMVLTEIVITRIVDTEPAGEPQEVEVTESAATPEPTSEPAPLPTPVATAPPETPAPAGSDPAALVQAEFARLAAGHVLYNPPDEMQVGRRERVEVRITQGRAETLAAETLQGRGAAVVESIPVNTFMKVRLTGDAFTITPLSSEEQFVVADSFTEWAWDLVPLQAGDQNLTLLITARVLLPGYPAEQRDLRIIERHIDVDVKPFGPAVLDFVRGHTEVLISAVLIPLAIALGRWVWPLLRDRRVR